MDEGSSLFNEIHSAWWVKSSLMMKFPAGMKSADSADGWILWLTVAEVLLSVLFDVGPDKRFNISGFVRYALQLFDYVGFGALHHADHITFSVGLVVAILRGFLPGFYCFFLPSGV